VDNDEQEEREDRKPAEGHGEAAASDPDDEADQGEEQAGGGVQSAGRSLWNTPLS